MPDITIKISGTTKAIAVIEDKDGVYDTVDFTSGSATPTVVGGGLAWLTLIAKGDPGKSVDIKLTNSTGGSIKPDHTYVFDTRGSIARSFQFDPDA